MPDWSADWHKSVLIISLVVYITVLSAFVLFSVARMFWRMISRRRAPIGRHRKPYGLIALVMFCMVACEARTTNFVCRDVTTSLTVNERKWRVSASGSFQGTCGTYDQQLLVEVPFGGHAGGLNVAPKNECLPYLATRLVTAALMVGADNPTIEFDLNGR